MAADSALPGAPFARVVSVSRRDGVIGEIKRAIVLGTIKPGEKLTETQLSDNLGVSRPTVREALNQLSQEGLVIQEPYRGLRVASLDAAEVLHIADVRMALDMQAVTCILADTTGQRMNAVMGCWEQYERSAFDPDALVQHESHIAFHRGLWAASGNTMLMKLWPVVEAHITIALAQDQATRHDPQRAHAVHLALIDAMRGRDSEAIYAAFSAHTLDSARELVAIMGE